MELFSDLGSYSDYLVKYPLHNILGINLEEYGDVDKKDIKPIFYSVDPNIKEEYPAELDDLIRLHHLIITRKVTTVLEFGVGKSSIVIDHGLQINKKNHLDFVTKNLRRSNIFQGFSVDNNEKWIDNCRNRSKTSCIEYHYSKCIISTFNDRICSYFENLPNICPDLNYLDGPDQFSPVGNIRGINTSHPDRLPMAADILAIEHFLLPATLIVVDGRTANARFLKSNLQRNWSYLYEEKFDQHYFELIEEPLGIYNKKQIDFCLGEDFYKRLNNRK